MTDGSLKFDTKIDSTGFEKGVANLGKIAATAVAAVGTAVTTLSAAAIKVGSDFEVGMSKVSAISGATADEMALLTAKAEEMGAKTKFTATQAAEALTFMGQAGWKTEQMLSGIDGVMSLASASGENLASVSDIVTDSLTAFGLAASDCAHFSDVLAMASNASNTDVAKMGATFKYVAPLAGALKYSIEDTAVAIGLMANAGIKGEQAGTTLRQMFSRLANPPKDAAMAMDMLQISITNADGSIKPLSETLTTLRSKFAELSDSEKTEMASNLAGQEAMSGLLAIVNASDKDFASLTEQIANSTGVAENMAEIMQDNLQGQLTILGSSLEAVGITAYSKFAEPMKEATKSAIDDVNSLNSSLSDGKMSESMDKIAASFADITTELAGFAANTAVPAVVGAFKAVIDNGKLIISIVGGITASILTFKAVAVMQTVIKSWQAAAVTVNAYSAAMAVNNAVSATGKSISILLASTMSAFELIVGVLSGKVTIATAAQIAWNAVLNANPVGIVITAVAALVAGIAIFSGVTKSATQDVNDLAAELDSAKKSADDLTKNSNIEITKLEGKAKIYEELRTKVKRTAEEETQLKNIAKELQDAMPNQTSLLDEQTKSYRALGDSIEKTVANMKSAKALEAMEVKYDTAKGQEDELKKAVENAKADLKQKTGEAVNAQIIGSVNTELYATRMSAANETLEKAKETLTENKKIQDDYWTAVEENLKENGEETKKSQDNYADDYNKETEKAFKAQLDILEKQKSLGKITEEQYYNELESLLKNHNADEMGEYSSLYAEIYNGRKSLNDKVLSTQEQSNKALLSDQESYNKKSVDTWEKGLDDIYKTAEKTFEDIENKKNSLADKLSDSGDLFEVEDNDFFINDLSEQTEQLKLYQEALEKLKNAGASDDFMAEFMTMDVSDALNFSGTLLSGDIDGYLKDFEAKQALSKSIADEFYADEVDDVQANFTDKIAEQMAEMPTIAGQLGQDTAAEFVNGIKLKMSEINELSAKMQAAVSSEMSKVSAAAIVTANQTASGGGNAPSKERILQPVQLTLDGKTISEIVIEYVNDKAYGSGKDVF